MSDNDRRISDRKTQMVHDLKIWPIYFQPVLDGIKRFELRSSDRDYKVGDTLHLREFDPSWGTYSGRSVDVRVTYILTEPMASQFPQLCLMSIESVRSSNAIDEALNMGDGVYRP
jgi:hypothetical protein